MKFRHDLELATITVEAESDFDQEKLAWGEQRLRLHDQLRHICTHDFINMSELHVIFSADASIWIDFVIEIIDDHSQLMQETQLRQQDYVERIDLRFTFAHRVESRLALSFEIIPEREEK